MTTRYDPERPQRAGRRAEALLDRAGDRLLPQRLLRDQPRGRRPAHRLRGDDRRVPGLLQAAGNDLSTPVPEYGFPGLKPGDRWCLCAPRWKEALDAGAAPQVVLEATHEETLAIVPLGVLKDYAVEA